jgi:uncharacterized damage-inducible protein DinB
MAGSSSTAASAILIRRDQSENNRLPGEILAQSRIQPYDYHCWVRRRILTVARTLASDDFIRPMGNSFSSVRDTLAHILGAEWIWLERWQGRSPRALLDAATFPTVQSLESRWETVEHDQMQFIEALTPQGLGEEQAYINQQGQRYSYLLWQ